MAFLDLAPAVFFHRVCAQTNSSLALDDSGSFPAIELIAQSYDNQNGETDAQKQERIFNDIRQCLYNGYATDDLLSLVSLGDALNQSVVYLSTTAQRINNEIQPSYTLPLNISHSIRSIAWNSASDVQNSFVQLNFIRSACKKVLQEINDRACSPLTPSNCQQAQNDLGDMVGVAGALYQLIKVSDCSTYQSFYFDTLQDTVCTDMISKFELIGLMLIIIIVLSFLASIAGFCAGHRDAFLGPDEGRSLFDDDYHAGNYRAAPGVAASESMPLILVVEKTVNNTPPAYTPPPPSHPSLNPNYAPEYHADDNNNNQYTAPPLSPRMDHYQ